MKNSTYKILLAISIIFNIAFIGNVIYHKYIKKNPYEKMIHENNLPHNDMMRFHRAEMVRDRRNYVEKRREFIEMLMAPNFDEKALEKKLNLTIDKEKKMERKMGEHLIELRKNMTPEEAKRFFRRILRDRRREFFEHRKPNKRRFRP